MLFESRRILLGFRIKVIFESSLKKENSYVYVDISKTHTISDLLNDIRQRFKVQENITLTLNDCPLLKSEDILVLTDVSEVKIIPTVNEDGCVPVETSHRCKATNHNAIVNPQIQLFNGENKKAESCFVSPSKSVEKLAKDEQNMLQNSSQNTNKCETSKRRRYYGSIVETIKFLTQNPNEVNDSCSISNSSEVEGSKRENLIDAKENEKMQNGVNPSNEVSFDETGDEFTEKKRRKRKRKHSKKGKFQSEDVVDASSNHGTKLEKKEYPKIADEAPRQHIFFGDEDENRQDTEVIDNLEQMDSQNSISGMDETFLPDNSKYIEKVTKSEEVTKSEDETIIFNDVGMEIDSTNVNTANVTYTSNFEKSVAENLNENYDVTSSSYSKTHPFPKTRSYNKSDKTDCYKPNASPKVENRNNFFNRFDFPKLKDRIQTESENCNPLATLLMCKQLQTPVEYNVQFSNSNDVRSRSNSSCTAKSTSSSKETSSVEVKTELADTDIKQVENLQNDDECEMLLQYKIVDDNVLLRDSKGSWITLTAKDAVVKLQPLEEPQENQSITFQILYLSQDMCPKMSNLICGKVISYEKQIGKLTLNILPPFIKGLMKDCGEDASLPEELVWITDNAYEIPWIALKNPRLLM